MADDDVPAAAAAAPLVEPTSSHDPLAQLLENSLEEMRKLLGCQVCFKPMYEPYTIACGHTFCYSCLVQWFETHCHNKSCPKCRQRVTRKPAPSYIVRDIARIFASRPELLPAGETTEEHEELRRSEAELVAKDREKEGSHGNGLFQSCFGSDADGPRQVLVDQEDRVIRCPWCYWELESTYCERCEVDVDDELDRLDDTHSRYGRYGHDGSSGSSEWPPTPLVHPLPSQSGDSADPFSSEDDTSDLDTDLDGFIEDDDDGLDDLDGPPSWGRNPFELNQGTHFVGFPVDGGWTTDDDVPDSTDQETVYSAGQHPLPDESDGSLDPEMSSEITAGAGEPAEWATSGDEDGDDSDDDDDTESVKEETGPENAAHQAAREPTSRKRRRLVVEDSSEDEDDTPPPRLSPSPGDRGGIAPPRLRLTSALPRLRQLPIARNIGRRRSEPLD